METVTPCNRPAFFWGALQTPAALAQEPEDPIDAERWKNGFLPTGTYAGPNVSVNLYNGNVIASIPLVPLPGRAGHDLNLALSYNSRQLTRYHDGAQWVARWFNDGPTAGRWVITA